MLQQIVLQNFKCFDALEVACAPLTLLCGLNGMGKSSVIQSLLVLRQSFESGALTRGSLMLDGTMADLGTGMDVLFQGADEDVIAFELHGSDVLPCRLSFDYSTTADSLTSSGSAELPEPWRVTPPFGGGLFYVNAERTGPQKFYPQSESFAQRGDLGARGEYTLNYLHAHEGETLVEDDPRCRDHPNRQLLSVVEHWLQEISPGVHLEFEPVRSADALISGFSFDQKGDVPTRPFRATNVGFGLSYILPVLTAMLTPPGTLCLIENPEAHLHPQGQTRMAELAVRAAIAGVQVIVETHSDHFLDGVRISVRDGLIPPEQTAIHYFEREGNSVRVMTPEVDSNGRLSEWPRGFFDQREENLMKLLAPRS